MAKTIPIARIIRRDSIPYGRRKTDRVPRRFLELSRHLLWLIAFRALFLFLGLNLADTLGLFPARLGPFAFLPFFNILAVALTLAYLGFWWSGRHLRLQLYVQIGADLFLGTTLMVQTRGIESVFVSFYLLIIIYSSLTLGRNGAIVGAVLSTIAYTAIVAADHLGTLIPGSPRMELRQIAFRVGIHWMGFFAVAFLGTYLSQRLRVVQEQLLEKIDSLNQLQRLNEHIVSSIRSGLITTDLQGRIVLFNNTAEELTGRERAEILDRPVVALIGEELWGKIVSADFFQDARPLRHENWIALPSGGDRFLGFSVSPLVDQHNQLLGYVISFQDLTEIKRLEEEIRVKDRMAAIGRMAAGIAHEIRNPLTSMRGSVEILRSRLNLSSTDERLLDILMRESDRLNKFVEDFLQFTRPGKYSRERVDLVTLLRDSVTLLQNSQEVREKHKVSLDLSAQHIPILGNADQLQQVFWNLAQNALRAMPSGGNLTIRAAKTEDDGGQITFQDSGFGMTQTEQSQLFQPFQSGFHGGAGLGLSIIFQIMEDHRGKIYFDSEKGRGTKVTLYLPPISIAVSSKSA